MTRELYRRVNEFAALLRDFCGLQAGDRVTLHMPMVPELPVVMLACARLGVIHSQVFGGFSGGACGQYASQAPMAEGRDFFVDELLARYRDQVVTPVSMPAEAPLFIMYSSGTTGRPKGCQHSTGGYLAYVAGTSRYYQDIHPDDTYWCMADIGWITGHSYIVYGPLALGTTSVIYEGVPNYPDAGRPGASRSGSA